MRWLIADWNGNKQHIFDGVSRALTSMGHSLHTIPRCDMERRRELVAAIRSGQYDALLTWQRFYRMQKDLLAAVNASRKPP